MTEDGTHLSQGEGNNAYFTERGMPVIRNPTSEGILDTHCARDALSYSEATELVRGENSRFIDLVLALYRATGKTDEIPSRIRAAVSAGALLAYRVLEAANSDNALRIVGESHYDRPLDDVSQVISALRTRLPSEAWCYTPALERLCENVAKVAQLEKLLRRASTYLGSRSSSSDIDSVPRIDSGEVIPELRGTASQLENALDRVHKAAVLMAGNDARYALLAPLLAHLYQTVENSLREHSETLRRFNDEVARADELDTAVDGLLAERDELLERLGEEVPFERRQAHDIDRVTELLLDGKLGIEPFLQDEKGYESPPQQPPGYNLDGLDSE